MVFEPLVALTMVLSASSALPVQDKAATQVNQGKETNEIPSATFAGSKRGSRAGLRRMRRETQSQQNLQAVLVGKSQKTTEPSVESSSNNEELVEILVKYSTNPNGYTALEQAVLQRDYHAIDILLANGVDINSSKNILSSPITVAVFNDDEPMVDYLLGKGATFNENTLIAITYYNDPVKWLNLLQDKGVPLITSPLGLRYLISNPNREYNFEVVKLFVLGGSDVTGEPFLRGLGGETWSYGLLTLAAEIGDIELAKQLIDHGANTNPTLLENQRPLSDPLTIAVYRNDTDMARLFLENGAGVDKRFSSLTMKDYISWDLLLKGFANHNYELVTLLLNYGHSKEASMRFEGVEGMCSLLRIAVLENDKQMAIALLEGGFSPNCRDPRECPPLKTALELENNEMALLLLQYGARLDCL